MLLDTNTQVVYCNKVADRWLATRLESIAAAVVGLAALFATQVVVSAGASILGDNSSFASLAGISLSYAVTATGMMQVRIVFRTAHRLYLTFSVLYSIAILNVTIITALTTPLIASCSLWLGHLLRWRHR